MAIAKKGIAMTAPQSEINIFVLMDFIGSSPSI